MIIKLSMAMTQMNVLLLTIIEEKYLRYNDAVTEVNVCLG